MNESAVTKPRRVIPRWRDFPTTAALGELGSTSVGSAPELIRADLAESKRLWAQFKNPYTAGDLLAAALVERDWEALEEAATYLLGDDVKVPAFTKDIAIHAWKWAHTRAPFPLNDERVESTPIFHHSVIGAIRRSLATFPRDAIYWVELALAYTVIGKAEKARRAIVTALHLSPNDRFVLRCATRCLVHLNDPEMALAVLSHSPRTKSDSWLLAAHVSVSEIIEKSSRFHKQAKQIVSAEDIDPFHLSELNAALATAELSSGNDRRSKKLFRDALVRPTENALAQALWAKMPLVTETEGNLFHVPRSFEANAMALAFVERWNESLEATEKWRDDEPFSARPASLGSFIAGTANDDHAAAIKFAESGLVASPGDATLLNNLAFSLACSGRLDKAKQALNAISMHDAALEQKVAVVATTGLIAFREGHTAEGRAKYLEAIELAERENLTRHLPAAAIHWALEELRANPNLADEAVRRARELAETVKHPFIRMLVMKLNKQLSAAGLSPIELESEQDKKESVPLL